jgi:glycerol-3-phosphate dehydrogenase (NAD(P)+)
MKIAVVGAGAWGTALAISACRSAESGHHVSLWVRDAIQAHGMREQRVNARYLPGVALPQNLRIHTLASDGLGANLAEYDLVIVATPLAGLRPVLQQLQSCCVPVAWLCKGFEAPRGLVHGLLGHEVAAQEAPRLLSGVLSGPSFALEVAHGQPTALVAASAHSRVRDTLVQAFHSSSLRVYASDDVVGVEVGGAVKNVLAIATGLCDGLQLGLNARAALITRGLVEMTRLGCALGARAETFVGLSGLGDLVLTATGDLSRNRKVGLLLAQGQTLAHAVASLGHVAEGVYCARAVLERAQALAVDMPIAQAVVALLDGQIRPDQAVSQLMQRDARAES